MTVRNLDALFRPRQVLVLGAAVGPAERQLLHNLAQSFPTGQRAIVGPETEGWTALGARSDWPQAELAVVLDRSWARPEIIGRLAAGGCRALLWPLNETVPAELLTAARPHLIRILGARAAGTADTRSGHNLSVLPLSPQAGSVALIAQSQSIAAAALDWAVGRHLGLSWLAVTGAEDDVDVADLLDHAALDPRTRAVALQVGRISGARKFMSAARAAARTKPVVVLQTQPAGEGAAIGADAVRSAAFRRAGLVECNTLGGLFDAIAALERLPVPTAGRVAVVGNGAGVCALATDALLRQGLSLTEPGEAARAVLQSLAPEVRFPPGAVDLGPASTAITVSALRTLLAEPGIDAVLFVRAPLADAPHAPVAQALAAAGLGDHLLTVWLGLETAYAARTLSARGRIATFPSADEAARALRYRRQHRLTRELLMQTPPPDHAGMPDPADVATALGAVAHRDDGLVPADTLTSLLRAYRLDTAALETPLRLTVTAMRHPELGMHLRLRPLAPGLQVAEAVGFPLLDRLLAGRLLLEAGVRIDADSATGQALADALVRLAQLVVDQPLLERLQLDLAVNRDARVVVLPGASLRLRETPLPARERLALTPYPSGQQHEVVLGESRRYTVRAVRPSDEPAVIALIARLDPEEIRLRFFHYIRHFTHDMAARLTQADYDRELTLVATPEQADEPVIATATLVSDPDGREAEFAVLVHHDYARLGLGRHMLSRLLVHARQQGIGTVYGDHRTENQAMLALARKLGFSVHREPDDPGCMRVEIAIGA